jgi:hypothetical protein
MDCRWSWMVSQLIPQSVWWMTKNSCVPRSLQLMADGIVAGASTGVANHVGVAPGQASEFCGIEARIHQVKMAERRAGIQAPWTFSTYVSQSSSRKRRGAVDRRFAALSELDWASCKNADCPPHANN